MSEHYPNVRVMRGIFGDISGALLFQRDRLRKPGEMSLSITPVKTQVAADIYRAKFDNRPEVHVSLPDMVHVIEGLHGQANSLDDSAQSTSGLFREIALNQASARRILAARLISDVMAKYSLTGEAERELSARHPNNQGQTQ